MINSISKELFPISIPSYEGEIKMLPFDLNNLIDIPYGFFTTIKAMISVLPIKEGVAFLTVDGRYIDPNTSHRRGGAHIDGNFIPDVSIWGMGGGNGGWKVGENGRALSTEEHKLSYLNTTGGLIMASNYLGCKGWNGEFDGDPGIGGDCRHIDLNKGFLLKPNIAYYGNSQFIHESLPFTTRTHRTLIRITLPIDYPLIN